MIEDLIADFSPETFGEWCREKFDRFTADPHDVPNDEGFPQARVIGYVNVLPDGEVNRPLLVMSVCAGQKINERSSRRKQFDFARKQLQAALDTPPAKVKGLFTQGLFAFHDSEGNFRLSLVSGRADGKRLVYSDFKRQSFFVHPGRINKTFRARMEPAFSSYVDLGKAFSVETLTKEFYNSLFAWYERAISPESKVTFPNDIKSHDDDRSLLAEHLIRLITRLMFVWFIRQKGLIPGEIFEPAELSKILKSFDPVSPKQDNYYRAILQNLFFATLNCEIKDRIFAADGDDEEGRKEHYGIKLLYRYYEEFALTKDQVIDLFRRVPFLNGGLFECLDRKKGSNARSPISYQDGFSRNPGCVAHIPNNLFFDDLGLITLFSRYDFTVDENDPNDSDVALDPELLGKVFENLLGAYNPETKETARKQSGSFYTPREIVNYMVDESLVAHLRTQVPEVEEPVIRQCLGGEEPPVLAAPLRRRLVAALYHCRILDPACGSGAFPMGLLLKMVYLLQRLDPKNALWHEVVMAEAEKALAEAESLGMEEKEQRRRRITESFDQSVNQPDYARKLYLIENCIFGVDIQPIAVQIAKLRAFITLVCDQTPDLEDAERNYRMLPLPNLETKFVAANTLIGLETDFADGLKAADGASLLNDSELHRLRAELAAVRHRHFRARNAPEKNACRKRDEELRKKIKARLVEIASQPDAHKIALWQAEIAKLRQQHQDVEQEDWQEVVQTTPTQGSLFDTAPRPVQTTIRVDVNKEKRDRIDDDIRRLTVEIESEQNRAKNKGAFQHEADRLADWDPYNQNASSPFFDLEWMFDVKDGFDVVIGNPPFIHGKSGHFSAEDKAYFKQHYETAEYQMDTYVLFTEKSLSLNADEGVTALIMPNTWLSNTRLVQIRRFLLTTCEFLAITRMPPDVFSQAVVDTVILIVKKTHRRLDTIPVNLFRENRASLGLRLSRNAVAANEGSVFDTNTDDCAKAILRKMEACSCEIASIAKISRGVHPYRTDGHGISRFSDGYQTQRDYDERSYHSMRKLNNSYFPEARGKHIHPYYLESPVEYISWGEWLAEPRDFELFKGERVYLRKIVGPTLYACYVKDAIVADQSIYIAKPSSVEYSAKYLLAILNSRLLAWYFRNKHNEFDTLFPQIKVAEFKKLPIATDPGKHKSLVALANKILSMKEINAAADTSILTDEIDQRVYELYGLTEDEIAIVEGRDAETKLPKAAAKPTKTTTGRQPRKSVMTDDPDLA